MLRSALHGFAALVCLSTLVIAIPLVKANPLMDSFSVYVDGESFYVGEAIEIFARINTTNPYLTFEVTDVTVCNSEEVSVIEWHYLSTILSDVSASANLGTATLAEEENYTVTAKATKFYDVNGDDILDMKDVGIVVLAFGSYPEHPRWNLTGDVNQDGIVDMKDIGNVCRIWKQSATCTFMCHLLEPNVVPEVPFGTIVTIIALLGATGFYAYKKRVSDSMHAPKSSSV